MKRWSGTEWANGLMIVLGLLLAGAGYRMFLVPNEIAPGGFTGIGQLANRLTGIQVGLVSILLNVPLFALSMRTMGLRFGLRSALASFGLSMAIDYLPVSGVTQDLMLAAVYGAVLSGAGFGLILRGSATTGGSDMLASLIHRRVPHLRVSVLIFSIDAVVIAASAFVFDAQAAMYALISAFLMNVIVDLVLEGPNTARSYFIISDAYEEISRRLMEELSRGVTAFDATGMYSKAEKKVLMCVISRNEAVQLRRIVAQVDSNAFVFANRVHEALGEGFRPHGK